ncbi:hypothetical protein DL95DRAFT_391459 [Leptodontidium sp. 2 PMI_412]|nr:hypothetical protein DL95DRAFT_391459 [Leptodontidium sp. 2 PMI_412]
MKFGGDLSLEAATSQSRPISARLNTQAFLEEAQASPQLLHIHPPDRLWTAIFSLCLLCNPQIRKDRHLLTMPHVLPTHTGQIRYPNPVHSSFLLHAMEGPACTHPTDQPCRLVSNLLLLTGPTTLAHHHPHHIPVAVTRLDHRRRSCSPSPSHSLGETQT